MKHNKVLPAVHELLNLANNISFPASRDDIAESAKRSGLPDTMVEFLNLFDAELIFDSKVDFMTRCEELEMFLEQEAETPKEITRGP
jgi:hypothetical protein